MSDKMISDAPDVQARLDGILEKFWDGETEPYERIYIEDEKIVRVERKGVDY